MISAVLEAPSVFNVGVDMSQFEVDFASPETRLNKKVTPVRNLVDRGALSLAFENAITLASEGLAGQKFEWGLDPLGNAKLYHQSVQQFGADSFEVIAQREVLEADMATLLMEEITSTNFFEKTYSVDKDGKIVAANQTLSEVYARCLASADGTTPAWMLERFTAELEEILSFEQLIASGQAKCKTYVTISPTPFNVPDAELEKYGMRGLLMIRFMSWDEPTNSLNLSQIQLPQDEITEGDLKTLFEELGAGLDGGHLDAATSMLETGILFDSNYLKDQTDIVKMLDQIIAKRAKLLSRRRHAFMGSFVTKAARDSDYQKLYLDSTERYQTQQQVISNMVDRILSLSLSANPDFKSFAEQAKKEALAAMSAGEIKSRYGQKIAEAYQAGGYNGAKSAGLKDGLSGSCPSSGSSKTEDPNSPESSLFCKALPKPGEKACCPGCKQMVIVTGTEDNIKCGNGACSLADTHSRAEYLASLAVQAKLNHPNIDGVQIWSNQGLGALFFVKKFISLEEYEFMQKLAEPNQDDNSNSNLGAENSQFALAA
ncbi:MAG TPA: hypothetical protein PKA29_01170 [Candidatus Saccharibacteria bacterium]|nr:hypothetical protein [Candidatus Saccharibacteria bacterium]